MKFDKYSVADGKVTVKGKFCPRCGSGVFMAQHENRDHCGRCGYTEFKQNAPKKLKQNPCKGTPTMKKTMKKKKEKKAPAAKKPAAAAPKAK